MRNDSRENIGELEAEVRLLLETIKSFNEQETNSGKLQVILTRQIRAIYEKFVKTKVKNYQRQILVVEDDPVTQRALAATLAPYGTVKVANDGIEAMQLFEQAWSELHPFDCIFLDLLMPKAGGKETLKALRETEDQLGIFGCARARVIITSAVDKPAAIIELLHQGGDDYIIKPVSAAQLKELFQPE